MNNKLLIAISLIAILLGVGFCFAKTVNAQEEPENISSLRILYQGQLFDSEGNPIADGKYNMRFRIYDAQEEWGNILWQEEYTFYNAISVETGQFKVILGRENPIELDLNRAPFWLGITIGTITEEGEIQWAEEIEPRKKITTLSELLEVEELTPEQWENLFQLIQEKLGDETEVVLLFDLSQIESLEAGQEIDFSSNIISFFQNFINFIDEKISEIGEKINQILTKIDSIIDSLANIVNTLAEMRHKIDALYNVLIVEKGLGPAETEIELPETSSEEISYSKQKVERLIFIRGETSVRISNQLIKEGSLIFITFLDDPGSAWWISEKIPGESFTISLKEPAPQDLRFDYWILDETEYREAEIIIQEPVEQTEEETQSVEAQPEEEEQTEEEQSAEEPVVEEVVGEEQLEEETVEEETSEEQTVEEEPEETQTEE